MFNFERFCAVLVLTLLGCGGGSSGGAGGANPFAGTYQGVAVIRVTAENASLSDTVPIVFQVSGSGQVVADVPGVITTGSCGSGPPVFLQGNQFSSSATLTCQFPDLGVCTVPASISGAVNGNQLSGSFTATYRCSIGVFSARITFTMTRITVPAASGS